MHNSGNFTNYMEQGAALHAAGKPEQALVAFESALALQPESANAASACATMLTSLGQPLAAYQVLRTVRTQLMAYADGAANLAIAAEACDQMDEARAAYARALELDPNHLRALNNTALISARGGDWTAAVERLKQYIKLAPQDLSAWLNLTDTLMAARRFDQAAALLDDVEQRFPRSPAFAIRRALVLAFSGQIEAAQAAMDAMGPQTLELARAFLTQTGTSSARQVRKKPAAVPDAYELFCTQAFDAMQECDWRDHDHLTAVIRAMLAHAAQTGQGRDGRDTQFYGLALPLLEDEMAQLRVLSIAAIGKALPATMAPFEARRSKHRDGRIHVGLATQTLQDPRFANALERQLQLHDRARFAMHVYSPTPQPDFAFTGRMAAIGVPVVEMAHMTDDEAVGRMRLDELDVFVDMAFDTPWCRPEIPERRVAPLQIRQITWHRHHPPRPCDYNMSDRFVHPPGLNLEKYGAVVRLPHTCWLAANDDLPDAGISTRADAGLPDGALVLCALLPALMVDPQTFDLWMQMLKALPQSVLYLPAYGAAARNNLARSAVAGGVDATRLVFMQPCTRAQMLSRIRLADLFVDALRFNANHGLVDALRMGVPAITCAGQSMASRLGGSIVSAAGLADCVLDTPGGLLETAVRLVRDPVALGGLRARLARQLADAPLFDAQSRVREWEAAWAMMVARNQAGLPPQAFDVPEQEPVRPGAA